MRAEVVESSAMLIVIEGSTIRYAYRGLTCAAYEIRGVSLADLSKLRSTHRVTTGVSSATMLVLARRYASSHFKLGTDELVEPATQLRDDA